MNIFLFIFNVTRYLIIDNCSNEDEVTVKYLNIVSISNIKIEWNEKQNEQMKWIK